MGLRKTDRTDKRPRRFSKARRKAFYRRWKFKLDNLSLRGSMILYIIFFLIVATFASAFIIEIVSELRYDIYNLHYDENYNLISSFTYTEELILGYCNFFSGFTLPIVFVICTLWASFLFYKKKLKKPLAILNSAAEKISENSLDFKIEYYNKDEMGNLCRSFETMRDCLEQNNKEMWRSIEERKRLNAAFSHDLRTPLTVLKGYTDFLQSYIPQNKIEQEKLLSTLKIMENHIARLEHYVETMNTVQKLEDISINRQPVNLVDLANVLKQNLTILQTEHIHIALHCPFSSQVMQLDEKIILQVAENLVSNALGYAKAEIHVTLEKRGAALRMVVSDDGKGFSEEELHLATKAFYKDKTHANSAHFGLGLNICKILCEKHGGFLILENNAFHGAMVTALFSSLTPYSN